MTPTLYADDITDLSFWEDAMKAKLARILPRRCPAPDCYDGLTMSNAKQGEVDHRQCDGRGWLYPDPPEVELLWLPESWEVFCEDVWRVLGIVEVTE